MDIVKLKDLTVDGKGTYGVAAPAVEYQEKSSDISQNYGYFG